MAPVGSEQHPSPTFPWRGNRSSMRLRDAEETTGTAVTVTPIHRWCPDGTLGVGCHRALPHHLDGEPILPHGGMLFFKMA